VRKFNFFFVFIMFLIAGSLAAILNRIQGAMSFKNAGKVKGMPFGEQQFCHAFAVCMERLIFFRK
jgi:hypothetical protein